MCVRGFNRALGLASVTPPSWPVNRLTLLSSGDAIAQAV
jgi:hypothetical protein